ATARAREEAAEAQARQTRRAEIENRVRILVTSAMTAFDTRNFTEAEALCRKVLALDNSVAVAHEMLGDLYERRGRREDASIAYSYAIQSHPRTYSPRGKLDRPTGRRPPPGVTRPPPRVTTAPSWASPPPLSREMTMGVVSILLFIAFCGVLALYASN